MEISKKINRETTVSILLMAALIYFIFFLKLDAFQIRPWDEATYANSAYEMWKNGKVFVPSVNGVPDMYNSKPLLPIWLQVISISMFGFNELAVRLPSAIAAAATAIGLFLFVRKEFNNTWAWTSFFVLITSSGFVHFHSARTGDMDALLAMFLAFAFFRFYRIINSDVPQRKDIFLYLLFIGLAFASKSFAALLFIPAQLFLLLLYRKLLPLLKSPSFYFGTAALIIVGFVPLIIRNFQQPGYFSYIIHHDALRLGNLIEVGKQPFDFYFNNFFFSRYSIWILISFIGMVMMARSAEQNIHRLGTSIIVCVFSFMLIISLSVTKLEWYDVPLYPLLAISCGFTVYRLLFSFNIEKLPLAKRFGLLFLFFCIPLFYGIKKSIANDIAPGDRKAEELSTYLFKADRTNVNLDKWCVMEDLHYFCLDFYRHKMMEQKKNLRLLSVVDSLHIGDHVLAAGDSIKNLIRTRFKVNEEKRYGGVAAFEVLALK